MVCRLCKNKKGPFVKGKNLCKKCDNLRGIKRNFIKKCKKFNIEYNEDDYLYFMICSQCKGKKKREEFNSKKSRFCIKCTSRDSFSERERLRSVKRKYISKCERFGIEYANDDHLFFKICTSCGKRKKLDSFTLKKSQHCFECGVLRQKIRSSISSRIGKAMKKNGQSMGCFLPYTIEELRDHLESRFESWMSWDNWGKYDPMVWNDNDKSTWTWNVDHIIPHSNFIYDSMEHPNFKKCWALSNLRPLSSKQNCLDGANRVIRGV